MGEKGPACRRGTEGVMCEGVTSWAGSSSGKSVLICRSARVSVRTCVDHMQLCMQSMSSRLCSYTELQCAQQRVSVRRRYLIGRLMVCLAFGETRGWHVCRPMGDVWVACR